MEVTDTVTVNVKQGSENGHPAFLPTSDTFSRDLLAAMLAFRDGDFAVRMRSDLTGVDGKIADAFNEIATLSERRARETARVSRAVGKEGMLKQRMIVPGVVGGWAAEVAAVNMLIDDLVWPTTEVTRAIGAVAKGDLGQTMALEVEGRLLEGEFLRSAKLVNSMIDQLSVFTSEVTRVAREVGTDGKLGGQAVMPGVAGTWKDLTDSVKAMASNLTAQVRNIAIDSAPGKGTRVRLVAPRGVAHSAAAERAASTVVPTRRAVSGGNGRGSADALRILLADDHAEVRSAFRDILNQQLQLSVIGEASNGFEAIAQAHALQPDVILMDISMPHMDGIEATMRIRAALPDVQIFGLSMQPRSAAATAIEEAGAAGYFVKGIDVQRLIEHLLVVHASGGAGTPASRHAEVSPLPVH